MTDNHPAGAITVVGLGPSGRAVIDLLVPVSPSAHSHIAVARDREALAGCSAAELILLRPGDPPADVMELRRALKGAGFVIIAGSTDEGITPVIIDVVKTQGSAVVRVVETSTTDDPRHGLDHMINEIISESNSWSAVGRSTRQAPSPDITSSSLQPASNPNIDSTVSSDNELQEALHASRQETSLGFGDAYKLLETHATNGNLAGSQRALRTLLGRVKSPTSWIQTFNPHPGNSLRVLLACPNLPKEFVHTIALHLAAEGGRFEHTRCRMATMPYADLELWRAMLHQLPSRLLLETVRDIRDVKNDDQMQRIIKNLETLPDDPASGSACSRAEARKSAEARGLIPDSPNCVWIESWVREPELFPPSAGLSQLCLERSWLVGSTGPTGDSPTARFHRYPIALIRKDGGTVLEICDKQ